MHRAHISEWMNESLYQKSFLGVPLNSSFVHIQYNICIFYLHKGILITQGKLHLHKTIIWNDSFWRETGRESKLGRGRWEASQADSTLSRRAWSQDPRSWPEQKPRIWCSPDRAHPGAWAPQNDSQVFCSPGIHILGPLSCFQSTYTLAILVTVTSASQEVPLLKMTCFSFTVTAAVTKMSRQDTGLPHYPALGGWVTSPSPTVLILKLKHLDTVFSYSSQIPGWCEMFCNFPVMKYKAGWRKTMSQKD